MNEPAFPALPISRELNGEYVYQSKGLTIRDYFAAKAMQALVQGGFYDSTATMAYKAADAMLKARDGNS